MKFLFIVNKWANFYFFIQNLSEWHFINRKTYNAYWRKELGPFSAKEKEALKKLKDIHSKYSFGKKYLGKPFFLSKNPWRVLEKQLSEKELTELGKIFSVLQAKFEALYKKERPSLMRWKKELQKKANNKLLIHSINNSLAALYNAPLLKNEIKVYLLFSSPTTFGGGGSINNQRITLEISQFPLKKIKSAAGAIWHEVIHAYFEKYYFLPLLHKNFPDDSEAVDLIQEATARAVFFPGGVLEEKFLKTTTPMSGISKRHIQSFLELKKLVKGYLQKNKSFDNKYIEKAFSLLSGLKGVIR